MDRTQFKDTEEHNVKLRTVWKKHGDAIALAHALRLQEGCEPVALLIEIGIGRHMAVENHRRSLRPPFRPGTQIFGKRDLAVRILRHSRDSLWPCLAPEGVQLLQIFFFVQARGHFRSSFLSFRN